MSIHPKDSEDEVKQNKKKYVRIWRLEASREFIFFMLVIVFAIATSVYNPIEIRKVSDYLVNIAQLNNQTNQQNLNNTDRIINYLDISKQNATASGKDIIKVLLLFQIDAERDIGKIMDKLNISNTHFVRVNNTHVITENGTAKLPYPLDLTSFVPSPNDNITKEIQKIKS